MKNYNKKGFTLIELLVVISIISLLSSIVIASLRTARLKAQDTAIIQSVRQMANLMALEINESNNYSKLHRGWIARANDCVPTSPASPWIGNPPTYSNYGQQMTDLCKQIRANQPSTATYTNTVFVNPPSVGGNTRFTIMAALPYRTSLGGPTKYVCLGSNGAFTTNGYYDSVAVPQIWVGSGCHGDPNF